MTSPNFSLRENTAHQDLTLPDTSKIAFDARNLRRERTGLHALVAISRNKTILAYDTFNVGRSEERLKLARAAYKTFGADLQAVFDVQNLAHAFNIFCLSLERWEEDQFEIHEIHGDHQLGPTPLLLEPLIPEHGGTILFAPPGTGKSYLSLLMAQSIHHGVCTFWTVQKRQTLFVNLERSEESVWRRLKGVNNVLGLPNKASLPVLTARGKTLHQISGKLRASSRNGTRLFVVDSLSRAGAGTMVDDENANNTMDLLNGIADTWFILAHTPKTNSDTVYGSQMYNAAADVVLRLKSVGRPGKIGLSIKMMKANDLPIADPQHWEMGFTADGLQSFHETNLTEYPTLDESTEDNLSLITDYMEHTGTGSATDIAKYTGLNRRTVAYLLSHKTGVFEFVTRQGKESLYRLRAREDHEPDRN